MVNHRRSDGMSSTVIKCTYTHDLQLTYMRKHRILANKRLLNLKIEILLPKFRGCILNLGMGCRKIRGAEFLEAIR